MKKTLVFLLGALYWSRRALAAGGLFLLAAASAAAQDVLDPALALQPIDINTLTAENILDSLMEPIYGMLVIAFGYLSAYIPVLKRWSPFARVGAFALAAGLGFFLFGVPFWKVASSYLLSSGLYAVVLKHIFPSKKASTLPG